MEEQVVRDAAERPKHALAAGGHVPKDEGLSRLEQQARRLAVAIALDPATGGSGVLASTPASSNAREFATHIWPHTRVSSIGRPADGSSRSSRVGWRLSARRLSS